MKTLNESSFSLNRATVPYDWYLYMSGHGFFYTSKIYVPGVGEVESTVWCNPSASENEPSFLTEKDVPAETFSFLKPDEAVATQNKPIDVAYYNLLAQCDEWHGGYVDGYGYMTEETSSSMYGNSIIAGGSVYPCGPNGFVAVRKAKFYQLKKEGRWRGGSVEDWGYVSENTNILGSSIGVGEAVSEGERTLGAIMLISCAMEHSANLASLQKDFEDCWNEEKKCYEIDSRRLSSYLQANFPYHDPLYGPDDMWIALVNHRVVFLRQITRRDNDSGETYGEDSMIVDYNPLKHTYEYLNPVGEMSIGSVPAYNVHHEVDAKVYIFKKY